MTVISLENRLRKIEARRVAIDHAIQGLSDDELTSGLRAISDDPLDHAFVDWFEAGDDAPLPPGVYDMLQRVL